MNPLRLTVGLDAIAALRHVRGVDSHDPDPAAAAVLALVGGVDRVCVQLMEDRRGVTERDVRTLAEVAHGAFELRVGTGPELIGVALELRPPAVTLVPEPGASGPSAVALDLRAVRDAVTRAARVLRDAGVRVSAVVEPDLEQVKLAHRAELDGVELCAVRPRLGAGGVGAGAAGAGSGGASRGRRPGAAETAGLADALRLAHKLGLETSAGGGLSLDDAVALASLVELDAVVVGHALCARSVLVGFESAVRELRRRLDTARAAAGFAAR